MHIRPMIPSDLDRLGDIDATIEAVRYLHLERQGEGLAVSWRLEERPLREKLIQSNPLDEEGRFLVKQIVSGSDEGSLLIAEHEHAIVGLAVAQPDPSHGTMRLLDVRIDYDFRRQGVGTAMVYQIVQTAREARLRAVTTRTRTNNFPAAAFCAKLGFDLAGINTHRDSNHDLVKEAVTLYWYAAFD